jgi:hypothetical protein
MEEVGAASAGETMTGREEEEGDLPVVDTIQLRRPPWKGWGRVQRERVARVRVRERRDPPS